MSDDWLELRELFNKSISVLNRKIEEAKRDIRNTQEEMGRFHYKEIKVQLHVHSNVMREYLSDLERQRTDLINEYNQERLKLVQNPDEKTG